MVVQEIGDYLVELVVIETPDLTKIMQLCSRSNTGSVTAPDRVLMVLSFMMILLCM